MESDLLYPSFYLLYVLTECAYCEVLLILHCMCQAVLMSNNVPVLLQKKKKKHVRHSQTVFHIFGKSQDLELDLGC